MGDAAEIVYKSIEKNHCPACGAPPGEPCRDNHGRRITHGERLHAFPNSEEGGRKSTYYEPRYD